MQNFAYEQNPKKWADYYGHQPTTDLFKKYVTVGAKALPRSIFISGKSGIGKTSLVRMLIRSFRCMNRPAASPEPCGTCAACLDLDERIADRSISDVHWIQPGGFNDEDSLKTQVKQALAAGARGQRRTDRPSHDVLWIVFDEWQTFPINIRQEILIRAEVEVPGNNVCYIFMTMQEERLGEEDKAALMRRGVTIRLLPFTDQEVTNFLIQRFSLQQEVAQMIAAKSRGSTGAAIGWYGNIKEQDPAMGLDAASYVLGYARSDHRWLLWQQVQSKDRITTIQETLAVLLKQVEPLELARQLHNDLLTAMDSGPTADQLYASRMLLQYQTHYRNVDLLSYLAHMLGMQLVTKEAVCPTEGTPLGYSNI